MKLVKVALAILLASVGAGAALAQSYPTRPIRLIVPFGAGGGTDNLARIAEPVVSRTLGQPLVIENRPGGGSVIGMDIVAKAPGDGYTLVMVDSTIAVNPALKPLPYDTLKDFAPVSLLATAPVILLAHPKVPAKTLAELVALAKANPGKLNYASGGNGSSTHLGGELLKLVAGIDIVHVPYKGTGPAMSDLIGGHVDVMFSGISSAKPFMDSGALRAYAVTGETRNGAVPDVPTFAEVGLGGVTASTYWGVLAPRGTPPEIVEKLSAAFARALKDPATAARLAALGYSPIVGGPADYADNLRGEIEKWGRVVRSANIKVE
ncbi:MAG TPA: tripartite tricarboxylate transporter substrate binding protein [Xanthobacteraceae bacterium]|nr:tripartite tricarboxylate transporter substrate binding protein [Xanthobacteraceae bacterium]